MRNVSFTIASLCLLLVVPQMTRAGDITYDIQNYPSDQVDYNTGSFDHSVSGTIMTDGTIGTLIATNILSWSVTFDNNPAETFQSTTLGYPSIYAISGLVATSSGSLTLGPGSNPYGLESAKPDLQSGFSKPGGDIPGPWIWVTVCSGMGEIAIRGGYWGGRRAMGGEMDTAARCGAGFSGCQDHPWDSLNSTRSRSRRAPRAGCDMAKACENSFRMGSHRPWG